MQVWLKTDLSRTAIENSATIAEARICEKDPMCIRLGVPLLKHQRVGLIDPDTPISAYNKTRDGKTLELVVG
jgi:beta-glucan synthesis-associated protein KRE6